MPKFFVKLVLILFGFFINSPKAAEPVTIQMLLEKEAPLMSIEKQVEEVLELLTCS